MVRILLVINCIISSISFAQNWTGNQDANWNNSANWSTWPLNGEDINIDPSFFTGNALQPIISSNSTFTPAAINISNGGVLTINANLTTSDDVEVIGVSSEVIVNNGVFRVNPGDGGRLIIDLGGSMTINGGSTLVDERFIAGEDALVTINDGIVSSGERLIMDLGGRFIQHNGSVTVGATFAMADGSINHNSSYELNDGTLNITGEMAFENEAGDFEPTFTQNGGDMVVNGDVFWFGESPGLGTPRWLVNGGTVEVTGIIENMPLSTVFMYLKVGGNAEFTFSGTAINTIVPQDTIFLTGTSNFIFESSSALNNEGVFNGELGSIQILSNLQLNGTGSFQCFDVYIQSTGTLNHFTNSDLKISGDFHKEGNFLSNNNTVVFNGSSIQAIDGTGILSLYNLTLDNTNLSGVVLGIETEYNGHLQLNDGLLYTSTLNSFTANNDATNSGASNASFVSGPMTKVGDDSFIFPVGKSQKYMPVRISAPQSINDAFMVEYFNNTYSSITPVNTPLNSISNIEYWNIDQTIGSSDVTIELFWQNASASGITDCGELSIANWSGSAWENILSTASGSCTGNGAGSILSNNSVSNYGPFTFGFYSGVTTQNVSICNGEAFVVGTSTYTLSGSYIDILDDVNMNDSIVLTTINVITPNVGVHTIANGLEADELSAQNYAWLDCNNNSTPIGSATNTSFLPVNSGTYALKITQSGCVDTSDCIDVVFIDTTICSGDTYMVGTNSYSNSGNYTDELTNTAMLDSVIFSNLSVFVVNTSVSIVNYQLVCQNTTADTYQWYDCNSNQIIPNENGSVYAQTVNGSYSVTINENGCESTSNCINISTLTTLELNSGNIQIYPNPAKDIIKIIGVGESYQLELMNSLGEVIYSKYSNNGTVCFDVNHLNTGVYFIRIKDLNFTQKVVIQQ